MDARTLERSHNRRPLAPRAMRPQNGRSIAKRMVSPMRLSRACLVGLCALGLPQASTAQPRAFPLIGQTHVWNNLDTSATIPVSFSFSGGISLGAYQAGVNWAMVEFFKLVRDSAKYRARNHLPRIVPRVMTGASAGNINVLLASIESCDRNHSRGADSSLLWQMWVYTGWNELSPPGSGGDTHSPDPGVLDRTAIRGRVMASIDAALRSRSVVEGCRIPIGVVATRVAPGTVGLDPHIEAENQRYVGVFEVREAGGRLELAVPPRELLDTHTLGAQLIIPPDDNGNLASGRVFDLVEASAAYPVAFAPRVLVYKDPDCVLNTPAPPGCLEPHHESFLDGGVFDNNPVGLADHMTRLVDSSDAMPIILYVDPNAARGKLSNYLQHLEEAKTETRVDGVNALLRFGGGFIPSSRKYELQTFIREQLSARPDRRAQVQSSTRAHPVVGEHIDAFAAFFGRPFREFDFYAGVSDGFQFLASEILCDAARMVARDRHGVPRALPRFGTTSPDSVGEPLGHLACIEAETDSLLRIGFGLSDAGRTVVARVASREFPNTFCGDTSKFLDEKCNMRPASRSSDPAEQARRVRMDSSARALLAIEQATWDQLAPPRDTCGGSGDLSAQLLCLDGFGRILDELAANKSFANTIDTWANHDPCGRPGRSAAGRVLHYPWDRDRKPFVAARCRAEFQLANFLNDSHAATQDIIDHSLQRLRSVEEQAADSGRPNSKFLVKTIDFVYRSNNLRGRRGFELDASSIPPNDSWRWQLFHFIPYYVGGAIGATGAQFGWKPTAYLGPLHLIVDAPAEVVHLPHGYDATRPYHWFSAVTPGVGHDFALPWLNQLSVGPRFELNSRLDNRRVERRTPTLWQASALTFLGKVRVSVYRALPNYPLSRRPRLVGGLSLADLNGILYWGLR